MQYYPWRDRPVPPGTTPLTNQEIERFIAGCNVECQSLSPEDFMHTELSMLGAGAHHLLLHRCLAPGEYITGDGNGCVTYQKSDDAITVK